MEDFQAVRVCHNHTQTNHAAPEQVFPLLCPVREAEWTPGWQFRLIYSRSGFAELGCVFATPNEDGSETIWVITAYDPAGCRIAFAWVWPGMVTAQIKIRLTSAAGGHTRADIAYTYTGLSAAGNAEVERYDGARFRHEMRSWEAAINHYLETGKLITTAA